MHGSHENLFSWQNKLEISDEFFTSSSQNKVTLYNKNIFSIKFNITHSCP
jgi:hypothetical protein